MYCEKENMQISILDSASEADNFKNYLKYIGDQCLTLQKDFWLVV
jgi:hypothetical protein